LRVAYPRDGRQYLFTDPLILAAQVEERD
jgi:hypothetical protein